MRPMSTSRPRGRRTTVSDIEQNFGRGRTLRGADALRVGMIDRLGDLSLALTLATNPVAMHAARPAALRADAEPTVHEVRSLSLAQLSADPAARRRRLKLLRQ
jgi:hypothetical protein